MEQQGTYRVEDYVPGWRFFVALGVVAAALISSGFYVASRYEWRDVESGATWLWLAGLLIAGGLGPFLIQYLLLRGFGKRFRRIKMSDRAWSGSQLVRWWRTEDGFTRFQFALVCCAPVLLVYAAMLAYVARFPTTAPVLGFIVPAYLPNFWYALLALRKPRGTMMDVFDRGVRFREQAGDP